MGIAGEIIFRATEGLLRLSRLVCQCFYYCVCELLFVIIQFNIFVFMTDSLVRECACIYSQRNECEICMDFLEDRESLGLLMSVFKLLKIYKESWYI